jgi:hypothetical protein
MAKSSSFHIRHWSSGRYIHPHGGRANNNTSLVLWDGNRDDTAFYLEFTEGPWGYLVCNKYPTYCVHPKGGAVDAGNGTGLLFHQDRHPGCYFTFNEQSRTVMHISGRYWHPHGGSAQAGNNTGVVLWDGYRDATKFYPSDASGKQVHLDLPVTNSSAGWRLVFAENRPLSDRTLTFKAKVGQSVSNTSTSQITTTFKAEMEDQLFGAKSKASLEVKSAFSRTDAKTWSQEQEQDVTYDIKKGQPMAVWQRVFTAQFGDGSVWSYGSGTIFYDTESSNTPPPSNA